MNIITSSFRISCVFLLLVSFFLSGQLFANPQEPWIHRVARGLCPGCLSPLGSCDLATAMENSLRRDSNVDVVYSGNTALHVAAASKNRDGFFAILKAGASLNQVNESDKNTPLHLLAASGSTSSIDVSDVLGECSKQSCNLSQKNAKGETILDKAFLSGNFYWILQLMRLGRTPTVALTPDMLSGPLRQAFEGRYFDLVVFFLQRGAQLNVVDAAMASPYLLSRLAHRSKLLDPIASNMQAVSIGQNCIVPQKNSVFSRFFGAPAAKLELRVVLPKQACDVQCTVSYTMTSMAAHYSSLQPAICTPGCQCIFPLQASGSIDISGEGPFFLCILGNTSTVAPQTQLVISNIAKQLTASSKQLSQSLLDQMQLLNALRQWLENVEKHIQDLAPTSDALLAQKLQQAIAGFDRDLGVFISQNPDNSSNHPLTTIRDFLTLHFKEYKFDTADVKKSRRLISSMYRQFKSEKARAIRKIRALEKRSLLLLQNDAAWSAKMLPLLTAQTAGLPS